MRVLSIGRKFIFFSSVVKVMNLVSCGNRNIGLHQKMERYLFKLLFHFSKSFMVNSQECSLISKINFSKICQEKDTRVEKLKDEVTSLKKHLEKLEVRG